MLLKIQHEIIHIFYQKKNKKHIIFKNNLVPFKFSRFYNESYFKQKSVESLHSTNLRFQYLVCSYR